MRAWKRLHHNVSRRPVLQSDAISHFQGFTGQSPAIRDIYDKIKQAARSDAPVFITGEGGTGKDICAEAINDAAKHLIRHYQWPGNVRQLQNEMRRITVMNDPRMVTPTMLSSAIFKPAQTPHDSDLPFDTDTQTTTIKSLAEIEQQAIERAIALCGGNIPKAAAALGVSPSTIYRKRMIWGNASNRKSNAAADDAL